MARKSNKSWTTLVIGHLLKAVNSAWGDEKDMLDERGRVRRASIAKEIGKIISKVNGYDMEDLKSRLEMSTPAKTGTR